MILSCFIQKLEGYVYDFSCFINDLDEFFKIFLIVVYSKNINVFSKILMIFSTFFRIFQNFSGLIQDLE